MEQPVLDRAREAAGFIGQQFPTSAAVGLILGTGSGNLADEISPVAILDYSDIPYFPVGKAIGHKGRLVCGRLADATVIALQGRVHLYEGYSMERTTFPIHVLHLLGVTAMVITNAAGGINPALASGDLMLIDSHIDLMFRKSGPTIGNSVIGRPTARTDVYDRQLIERALCCARQNGFAAHRGVYASMLGPNYETRAEYRFLRKIGVDAAGMSTVPEVVVAGSYGHRVLGISVIANTANPDQLQPTSGEAVVEAAQLAAANLATLVVDAIETITQG